MKGKLLTFIELAMFTKKVEELGGIELLVAIENDLLADPERGAVIQKDAWPSDKGNEGPTEERRKVRT